MNIEINKTLFYCKKKLNLLDITRKDTYPYPLRQIIEYKESDFLEHIEKYLPEHYDEFRNPNKRIFDDNFPLTKVLEEIKKYIPSEKRLLSGDYDNLYVFKYDNCGKVNNKNTDYFSIICFHDTSDIITMYPSLDCQNLPYIDLNYINLITDNNKTKKIK